VKITPVYLAALAVEAIPHLDIVGTRPPFRESEDFATGCVVDARGRRWMVTCPKNATAGTAIEAEAGLAPLLLEQLRAGNLPFDIFRPAGFAQVKDAGRAVIYPEPFGAAKDFESLTDDDVSELGRALASIHGLPVSIIEQAGLPVYSAENSRVRLATELDDVDATSFLPSVLRRRWDSIVANPSLWNFEPRVVHGDVAGENFLWANGSIATVLGFSDAHVGDPAADFGPLLGYGEDFTEHVIESYEHTLGAHFDDAARERARFYSEYALARWLMFGKRTQNADIVAEARDMLHELAEEVMHADAASLGADDAA
jgi:hypothetical protein